MSEHVVQVARNTFAFRNFGEMLDLFISFAQPAVHAVAFGEESITGSDDHGKKSGVEKSPAVEVKEQAFDPTNGPHRDQADSRLTLAVNAKREHGRCKNKERACAGVDGLEEHPEQHHSADVHPGFRDTRTQIIQGRGQEIQRRR